MKAPPPFTLLVEQSIPVPPPEWEFLQLRELEARLVNAPDDAARGVTAMELEALRQRMNVDHAVVLLGRMNAGAREAPVNAAVLVPAGMGGNTVTADSSVRVMPSAIPFPASALGEAARAFPSLRLFGTPTSPGFVAESFEPVATTTEARTISGGRAAPWARRTATALAESANLVVDAPLAPGPMLNGRIPVAVTVRNSGAAALPPCEVFVEFMDGSGNLIHREFRWVTAQRSEALEAHLPALAPGAQTTIEIPLPPNIAAQAQSARVLILKALPTPQAAS